MNHQPVRKPAGVLQSGIPKHTRSMRPDSANGLHLKGVVTATYVLDDESHPRASDSPVGGKVVYCDVLCYTNISGMRWRALRECLVMQKSGGIHDGDPWIPRATKRDVSGQDLDVERGGSPADFDGDHVVVGFLNDSLAEPIILGGLPHPKSDLGNEESTIRQRLQLRQVDGLPRYVKHHGTTHGVDTNGNYSVDTRYAWTDLTSDGFEPEPPTDGKGGQSFDLPLDAEFNVRLWDMSQANDQGDDSDPKEKVTIKANKNKTEVVYDEAITLRVDKENDRTEVVFDSGLTMLLDGQNDRAEVTFDGGVTFLIDNQNGIIENGAEGSSFWLVRHDRANDEHQAIRQAITDLSDKLEKLQFAVNMQVMPLIPNPGQPIAQLIPSEITGNVGGSAQNVLLAEECKLGPPPVGVDADATAVNLILLPEGGNAGDVNSERVKTDK